MCTHPSKAAALTQCFQKGRVKEWHEEGDRVTGKQGLFANIARDCICTETSKNTSGDAKAQMVVTIS